MTYPIKPNRGALFKYVYKKKPTEPDFTGILNIDRDLLISLINDPLYKETCPVLMSMWNTTAKTTGKDYFNISISKVKTNKEAEEQNASNS
jgi:hypothetical protein